MVTDAGTGTDTADAEAAPQYLTQADLQKHIAALQSSYDRQLHEERQITDDYAGRVRDLEARLEAAETRGLEDDDPRVVALNKQLRDAQKDAREAKSLVSRFSGSYRTRVIEAESLKLARGDETKAADFAKILANGRTEQQVVDLAHQIRSQLAGGPATAATPAPPRRPEVDEGRGAGRGGSERITQALYSRHLHEDADGGRQWRKDNQVAIAEWTARGSP
jgi:hypothetical protein